MVISSNIVVPFTLAFIRITFLDILVVAYPAERRAEILKAYQERSRLGGLERTFGIARQTVSKWLRQEDEQLPCLPPLDAAQADDVLELDGLWSFVGSKKRWIWIALCRRTRQIVAYFIGGCSEEDCWRLWSWIPHSYRHCATFSEFGESYDQVFVRLAPDHGNPLGAVGKETGATSHVERWNNTLRQRLGRFVRKTLSFSKSDEFHEIALRRFIHLYNQKMIIKKEDPDLPVTLWIRTSCR